MALCHYNIYILILACTKRPADGGGNNSSPSIIVQGSNFLSVLRYC